MTASRNEQFRRLLAEAFTEPDRTWTANVEQTGPIASGDLFVFPLGDEPALEWLVVRPHPDDPTLLFVVPLDDFPLAGSTDLTIATDLLDRPITVRCDQGLWLPVWKFQLSRRVDCLSEEALAQVRHVIADLVRGRIAADPQQLQVDGDPDYERWLAVVAQCRERLRSLMEQ